MVYYFDFAKLFGMIFPLLTLTLFVSVASVPCKPSQGFGTVASVELVSYSSIDIDEIVIYDSTCTTQYPLALGSFTGALSGPDSLYGPQFATDGKIWAYAGVSASTHAFSLRRDTMQPPKDGATSSELPTRVVWTLPTAAAVGSIHVYSRKHLGGRNYVFPNSDVMIKINTNRGAFIYSLDNECKLSSFNPDGTSSWDGVWRFPPLQGGVSQPSLVPAPKGSRSSFAMSAHSRRLNTDTIQQAVYGLRHMCVLWSSGDITCYGENNFGMLGTGNTLPVSVNDTDVTPVDIGGRAIQIASGYYHTCALREDFEMFCWGNNEYGQYNVNQVAIGDDEAPSSQTPVATGVSAIAANFYRTCFLKEAGADLNVTCLGDPSKAVFASCSLRARPLPIPTHECPVKAVPGVNIRVFRPSLPMTYGTRGPAVALDAALYEPVTADTTVAVGSLMYYSCDDDRSLITQTNQVLGCDVDGLWKPLLPKSESQLKPGVLVWNVTVANSRTRLYAADCPRLKAGKESGLYDATHHKPAPVCVSVDIPATATASTTSPGVEAAISCLPSNVRALRRSAFYNITEPEVQSWLSAIETCGLSSVEIGMKVAYPQDRMDAARLFSASEAIIRSRTVSGMTRFGFTVQDISPLLQPVLEYGAAFKNVRNLTQYQFITTANVTFNATVHPIPLSRPNFYAFNNITTGQKASRDLTNTRIVAACSLLTRGCSPPTLTKAIPPIIQAYAVPYNTYDTLAGRADVEAWFARNKLAPQSTLQAMWNAAATTMSSNGVFLLAGVAGTAVVSESLPQAAVIVRTTGDLADYRGITCSIMGWTGAAQTALKLVMTPTAGLQTAVSGGDAHYYLFGVQLERQMVASANLQTHTASLQCSPTFATGATVDSVPVIRVPITTVPAMWAIPRGAAVHTSSLEPRKFGVPVPSCLVSDTSQAVPWTNCTQEQLSSWSVNASASNAVWLPITLDLSSAVNITFVLYTPDLRASWPAEAIRIEFGNAECETQGMVRSGPWTLFMCTAPSYAVGCAVTIRDGECSPQRLRISVRDPQQPSVLPYLNTLSLQSGTPSADAFMPTLLQCDPACDLVGIGASLRTTVGLPTSTAVTLSYDVGSWLLPDGPSSTYSLVATSSRLQRQIPITYFAACVGYPEPGSDECNNPQSTVICAFGQGEDCKPCPRGSLCPGGYRALPLPGHWAPDTRGGLVVACDPPAERCGGWDAVANQMACGLGYDPASPRCAWCALGYYKPRGAEGCQMCPDTDDPSTIIIPIVTLLGGIGAVAVVFTAFLWIVAKLFGGTVNNGAKRTLQFAAALFNSVQLVATVTSVASDGLPDAVKPVVDVFNALQIQGILVDEACLRDKDPYIRVYVLSALALAAAIAVYITSSVSRCKALPARVNKGFGLLVTLLMAGYGLLAQSFMSTYQCNPSTMTVRTALPLLLQESDGGASYLAAQGISSSMDELFVCDSNALAPGCGPVIVDLSTEITLHTTRAFARTVICGGSLHTPALVTATFTVVLVLLTLPTVIFLSWRKVRANADLNTEVSVNPLSKSSTDKKPVEPAKPVVITGPLHSFLENQYYKMTHVPWWLVDCALLLSVAAILHGITRPPTVGGIWAQAAAVCVLCFISILAKVIYRPFKPENFHLFVSSQCVSAYSILLEILLAITLMRQAEGENSSSFDDVVKGYGTFCVAVGLVLLIIICCAFAYGLVSGFRADALQSKLAALARKKSISNHSDDIEAVVRKGSGNSPTAAHGRRSTAKNRRTINDPDAADDPDGKDVPLDAELEVLGGPMADAPGARGGMGANARSRRYLSGEGGGGKRQARESIKATFNPIANTRALGRTAKDTRASGMEGGGVVYDNPGFQQRGGATTKHVGGMGAYQAFKAPSFQR